MIKRFLSLFHSEPQVETITRDQVPSLVEKRTQEGEQGRHLQDFSRKLVEIADALEEACSVLETAQLKNENIPQRAKVTMEGNREAYLQRTRDFAGQLRTFSEQLANKHPSQVMESTKWIKEQISEYSKATQKQYKIMQEFFANESYKIASHIKQLEHTVNSFEKDFSNSRYYVFHEVRAQLEHIQEREKKRADIGEQKEEARKQREEEQKRLKQLDEEIERIRESEDYQRYTQLCSRIEELQAEKKQVSDALYNAIAPLSRALKKFSKSSMQEQLIHKLIENPYQCLLTHSASEVYKVLTELHRSVDRLGLKENVQKKSRSILEGLSQDWIKEMGERVSQVESSLQEAEEEKDRSDVADRIKQQEEKKTGIQNTLKELKQKEQRLKQEASRITTDDIEQRITEELEKVNIKVDYM